MSHRQQAIAAHLATHRAADPQGGAMYIQAGIAYCLRGHEYTQANTRWRTNGKRRCIQCEREEAKRRRQNGAALSRQGRAQQAEVAAATARGDVDTDACAFVTDDWVANIYAGIVKIAWSDFEAGYRGHGMPDAGDFLRAAGLLTSSGARDNFGHKVYRRARRKAF